MNILYIGDIVGKPGKHALDVSLQKLRDQYDVNLCIGNGENASGGFGITPEVADELFDIGIDVITSGNHIFDKKEIFPLLDRDSKVIRPANYPSEAPGKGSCLVKANTGETVAVVNLIGRVFMDPADCPFKKADSELSKLKQNTPIIFVDMHAEVTSEKTAMGWYLDGRATAVIGSHTHVQTADERILPKGTAYLSDAGMTGPKNSVIGVKTETAISKFISKLPRRFETATGESQLRGVIINVDTQSGKAKGIERIQVDMQ
jgi:metallophosphoesterase (TIGR00282 family)